MTTKEKTRMPASEEKHAGLADLLNNINTNPTDAHLNHAMHMCVERIADNQHSQQDCTNLASFINWSSVDPETLVEIITLTGDKPYAEKLVNAILLANKIDTLEYFEEIFQKLSYTNLHTVDTLIKRIIGNGEWYKDGDWWLLAVQFANKAASLLRQHDAKKLQNVVELHNFSGMNPWFVRVLALYAFDCEHGHLLLSKTIHVLHLEDIGEHVDKIKSHPHLVWSAHLAVFGAIKAFGRYDYNWLLTKLAPIAPPEQGTQKESAGRTHQWDLISGRRIAIGKKKYRDENGKIQITGELKDGLSFIRIDTNWYNQ